MIDFLIRFADDHPVGVELVGDFFLGIFLSAGNVIHSSPALFVLAGLLFIVGAYLYGKWIYEKHLEFYKFLNGRSK